MWARVGTIVLDFPTTAFPDDGLTMAYNSSNFDGPYYQNYLSLGGSDFDAYVGALDLGVGTTTTSTTSPGFTPTCIFLMTVNCVGDENNNNTTAHSPGFGFTRGTAAADNISVAHSACYLCAPGIPNYRYFNTGMCVTGLADGIPAALQWQAALQSFDANGFTLTHTLMPATRRLYYLAIRDGMDSFVVGHDTQRTSNGSKTTSGLGLNPGLLVFIATSDSNLDSVQSRRAQMLGAATDNPDGIAQAVSSHLRRETTNRSATIINETMALSMIDINANAVGNAVVTDMSFGEFTLDWTSVDGTARNFGYLAASCTESFEGQTPEATIFFTPNANTTQVLTEAILGWSVGFQAATAGNRAFISHTQPDENFNSGAWIQGAFSNPVTGPSVSLGGAQIRTLAYISEDTPFPGGIQPIIRYNYPRNPFTVY